ncbi:hypothetical protein BASA50_004351 [Batrachochytrium salamandrivorans]|uniref:Uncharacterized protein n=1 Tax=Batrachochytrium salamandrivorans TaxID=1357716 RepID=A0ABQ8FFS5_9FUNG|nr:hypothetical protein BASA62_006054 [Batrachochytrium salamandrivorans]KAH6580583.1 hypothetical protein BASA61_009544 [Batrachochytrium salamandrivorans]KAH6597583.1 hypothetical protein BASA50_004351 [Batrachochytrium salamandrivorans]
MKLISFAVISLLTITVSAQILPGTSAAKYALQSDQNLIHDKIRELTESCQIQQELVLKLRKPGKVEEKERETRLQMEKLEKEFETSDLSGVEETRIQRQYSIALHDSKEAQAALVAKKEKLKEAMEQRSYMKIKISILEENIEQKEEQDAKSKGPIGASPGSSPHRKILERQIDEVCRNAADLFDANKDANEILSKLDSVIDKTKDPKKELELSQTRNKLVNPYNKLLEEFWFVQSKCARAKELQMNFDWQPQSSGVGGVVQSLWQKFGMN